MKNLLTLFVMLVPLFITLLGAYAIDLSGITGTTAGIGALVVVATSYSSIYLLHPVVRKIRRWGGYE